MLTSQEKPETPIYQIMSFLPFLHRVCAGEDLDRVDAFEAMNLILEGQATTAQIAGFLVALRMRQVRPDELLGFARAMREKAERIDHGMNSDALIDTCGTGGGGPATFNISTIAAFVVAATGLPVAKHGNRSNSTACGSADILEELGVNIHLPPERIAGSMREVGIGFLFAPLLHPAMKHAAAARAELKMRTVFNLLGPLTNPAGARIQLIGAPAQDAAELMAGALAGLGTKHAFIVHGLDGMDEVSTTGPTLVYEIAGGKIEKHLWTPADFGVRRAMLADLAAGDRKTNCATARAVLSGAEGAPRDIVLVNAAVALVAAGRASDLREGVAIAAATIDSGAAQAKVEELARYSVR
jgi:anthranilate phosphoribosyltransferase